MPEPMENRIVAAVLREAVASGSMEDAIETFGQKLNPERRSALLSQISPVELAALRSFASKNFTNLPGDKLA
jgi:hypothetical protein